MSDKFLKIFKNKKPIFAMLHLKGNTDDEVFNRAKKEIDIYMESGVDAIIVENYYGNYYQMEKVLEYLKHLKSSIIYGVNCLNNDTMGFDLAERFGAAFVQFDSVAGHLKERDDYTYEAFINKLRKNSNIFILGGVRFKYQPYLSNRDLKEDLLIGIKRCDAIVVTQDATGQETSMNKINEFRSIIKDFPLIIGAGITLKNCVEQLSVADGAIVGSYFKDTYKDTGEVDKNHVKALLSEVKKIR